MAQQERSRATPENTPKPWPLRLAARLGGGSPRLFGALFAAVFSLCGAILLWGMAQQPYADRELAEAIVVLTMDSVAVAYICGMLFYGVRIPQRELRALQTRLTLDETELTAAIERATGALDGRHVLLVLAIAITAWILVNPTVFYLLGVATGEVELRPLWLFSGPLAISVWLVLVWSSATSFVISRRVGHLIARHARVDLLDPSSLSGFGAIGVRFALLVFVGLAILPTSAILRGGIDAPDWIPAASVALPLALLLLLQPMLGVHRAVIAARDAELARIDAALATHDRAHLSNLVDPVFGNLLAWRAHVAGVPEWPVFRGNLSRLLLYGLLPPMAWIAAALVERLLDNLI